LLGKGYIKGYIESEAIRYIEEALLINPYIVKIYNIDVSFSNDNLNIYADIETVYGNLKYSI
jgi:hypothetical protein